MRASPEINSAGIGLFGGGFQLLGFRPDFLFFLLVTFDRHVREIRDLICGFILAWAEMKTHPAS